MWSVFVWLLGCPMAVPRLGHLFAALFLYHGALKGGLHGISLQCCVAQGAAALLRASQFFRGIRLLMYTHLSGKANLVVKGIDLCWKASAFVTIFTVIVMGAAVRSLRRNGKMKNLDHDHNSEDLDTWGRNETSLLFQKAFGRDPPGWLRFGLVYIVAVVFTFVISFTSCTFNPAKLYEWVVSHPNAQIAIFDNFLRGVGLLPQLHVARQAGAMPNRLALWVALLGVNNILELADDGRALLKTFWSDWCYLIGDAFSLLLVSDFMWIFVVAKWRGDTAVAIPF
eukprot:gnl/TRDRNA2_/TRDRNA2_90371_c0_seq1.p1 gnl/TRDRNA2_/TRDRNA2_90371_c0~~gnl/TRDRNA2_/TRDRNA2_90371_c0_seq1.p1  ORF type:complete len:283 (+),score=39.81 gnl/TRDRNA2_/TRDRNA2_90371_c0_seq1:69-917(+)